MNLELRQLLSTACDTLVSEDYTEDQIAARLTAWQAQNPDADAALLATYQFTQTRDFSEALLGRVLEALAEEGYLHK